MGKSDARLTQTHPAAQHSPYNSKTKAAYLKLGTKLLRSLATCMQLPRGTYDVRTSEGGIAVPGECILHSDHLHLQICNSYSAPGPAIMYRTCKGRKDYSGGRNNWAPVSRLDDIEAFAIFLTNWLKEATSHGA